MGLTKYLILRYGSNAANQGMRKVMPVAIVEARNRAEAVRAESLANPTLHDAAWLALDSSITCWANQWFEAIPVSKAPRSLVREVRESATTDNFLNRGEMGLMAYEPGVEGCAKCGQLMEAHPYKFTGCRIGEPDCESFQDPGFAAGTDREEETLADADDLTRLDSKTGQRYYKRYYPGVSLREYWITARKEEIERVQPAFLMGWWIYWSTCFGHVPAPKRDFGPSPYGGLMMYEPGVKGCAKCGRVLDDHPVPANPDETSQQWQCVYFVDPGFVAEPGDSPREYRITARKEEIERVQPAFRAAWQAFGPKARHYAWELGMFFHGQYLDSARLIDTAD